MAFMDISPIINVVKAATPPPHQAQPSVAETMKPVPETEIQAPVPPPAKSAQSGLGERFDHYDTEHRKMEHPKTEHVKTAPAPAESKAQQVIPHDAPTPEVQAAIVRAQVEKADKADKAAKAAHSAQAGRAESEEKDKVKVDAELLGTGTGLPQPSVEPVHQDLPFLKPLGMPPPLGRSIDARI